MPPRIPMPTDERGMLSFTVSSGYGANTRQPFVQVEVGPHFTQMSPAAARALALNLLQAAEAAEGDEALIAFFAQLEMPSEELVAMLTAFRRHRDHMQGAAPATA